jgi:hypothetical protein
MIVRDAVHREVPGNWLGPRASLSLRRFIALYRKYSDDQPRDERGRWVETDSGEEGPVDTTGSTEKYLEPTGDPEIDLVTLILADKLENVLEEVGPGSGASYGTMVHSRFEASVRAANISGVSVERSWRQGLEVSRGTSDSIRTDVSLRDASSGLVRAIWDQKTGGARMTDSRADQIRKELGAGKDVPIIEIHYDRGSRIKAAFFLGEMH